jgi:hypothetical protein
MGTSSLLDIIGSIIIGGILLITALRLNAAAQEYSAAYYSSYILQSNLLTLIVMVEDDFKHIGYCKNPRLLSTGSAIVDAESTKIQFRCDYYNNGSINTVTYWAGPTSELTSTDNPSDFYLYKQIDNNTPTQWNLGTTLFKLKYWDNAGTPDQMTYANALLYPGTIAVTDLVVKLESPFKEKQQYMMDTSEYQLYWREMRMISQSFRHPR